MRGFVKLPSLVGRVVGRIVGRTQGANGTANAPNRPKTSTERWHKHKANDPELFNAKRRERDRLARERKRAERDGTLGVYVTPEGVRYFVAMAEEWAAMKAEKEAAVNEAAAEVQHKVTDNAVPLRQRT